jgi:proteasome accessory factor B
MVRALTTLQSGQRYDIDDLAKMLGRSRRTIYRDLKDLREAGVPWKYDKKNHYYSVDSNFFLPPSKLNTQEALSLFLLVFKIQNHIHFPFKNSASLAVLKIENNLPDEMKRYCNTALRHISVRPKPQRAINLFDEKFVQLLKAILNKRIMKISYYLPLTKETITTDLCPYHLRHNDYTWYVIGKSDFHKKVCTFDLNQIRKLETLDKCFIEDKEFDVNDYFGKAWSIKPGGSLYHVKLKFAPKVVHNVTKVQWHRTQRISYSDDGSAIIDFRVDGLNEIIWWILSYGDNVRILAPEILREKVAKIARNILKNNEQK